MRRIVIISVLIMALSAAYGFAQTGNYMMKGQGGGMMGGGTMQGGRMMQRGGMMEHGQMMNDVMRMTDRMSRMMGKLSGVMKDMPRDKMMEASGLMRDMSRQMLAMSRIMQRGNASNGEMKELQLRMREMQKKFSGIERTQ